MGNNQLTNSPNHNIHDPEKLTHAFFGNEYNPGPINWSTLQQSTKQQNTIIHHSHDKQRTLSEVIAALQHKVPDFSISKVIKLNELEHRLLTELLFKIPLAELEKKFGKRCLYYLFLTGYCFGKGYDDVEIYIRKTYGQQAANHLEIARYGSWRIACQSLSLMQQFTMLAMLQTGESSVGQLTHHLSQNFSLQYLQLAKEKTHGGWVVGYEPIVRDEAIKAYTGAGMHPNIRADGPICIGLLYDKQPVAIISGYLREDNSFMINQMQKVSYDYYDLHGRCTKHAVHPIMQQQNVQRQQTLFDVTKQFASHYGVTSLIIQGSVNNKWTKELQTIIDLTEPRRQKTIPNTVHLSADLAHQIYDCFAQQQGMMRDNQNNRIQKKKK